MSKTFFEMYKEAMAAPSPRMAFLKKAMDATGCTYEAVQKWAYGAKRPTREHREMLAKEFGVPAAELFPDTAG